MRDGRFKLIPNNVTGITALHFILNGDVVTGLQVGFEVNYGDMTLPWQDDIWGRLTATQKTRVQNVYDALKGIAEALVTESQ